MESSKKNVRFSIFKSRVISRLSLLFRDQSAGLRIAGLLVVLIIYLFFSFQNIDIPFNHFTDDVSGLGGIAAENLNHHGWLNLKFGVYTSLDISQQPYTHHPQFFTLPTAIFYKLFGISEASTRFGLLSLMLVALVLFYFALAKLFRNSIGPFLITLSWVLMPGAIYYGKSLEITIFSIPTALISFSFLIFFLYSEGGKRKSYFILFWFSAVIGCLFSWFYCFFLTSFWLFILIFKVARKIPYRRQFLVFIPVLLVLMFFINIFHFYLLKGPSFFYDLLNAFHSRILFNGSFSAWLSFVFVNRGELNYTWLFLATSVAGIVLFLVDVFKKKIPENLHWLLVFFFAPLALACQFRGWITHPFGIIMFLPAMAISSGYLFYRLIMIFRSSGVFLVVLLLTVGLILSMNNLSKFYNKLLILGENDILLLKQLNGKVADKEVCLGENEVGIDFRPIVEWYLQKSISSPDDLSCKKILVFCAGVSREFFNEKADLYKKLGYLDVLRYADYWCLVERK